MSTITNLDKARLFLTNEITDPSSKTTAALLVTAVDTDSITVASSKDEDLLIKLRGVKKITVGSTVTVDTVSGKVTVMNAAVKAEPPVKQTTAPKGCSDRSSISR